MFKPTADALKFQSASNNSYMVKQDKIIAQVMDSDGRTCLIEFQKGSNKVKVKEVFNMKKKNGTFKIKQN